MASETTQYMLSGPKTMETGRSMAREWTCATERNENLKTGSSTPCPFTIADENLCFHKWYRRLHENTLEKFPSTIPLVKHFYPFRTVPAMIPAPFGSSRGRRPTSRSPAEAIMEQSSLSA